MELDLAVSYSLLMRNELLVFKIGSRPAIGCGNYFLGYTKKTFLAMKIRVVG